MLDELKIGLIGAGWTAGEHVASLAAIGGVRVVAVCDINSVAAKALAGSLGAQVSAITSISTGCWLVMSSRLRQCAVKWHCPDVQVPIRHKTMF